MIERFDYFGWQVDVDVDQTRIESAVADDRCTCNECRNYYLPIDSVFPGEFLEVVGKMGIDYRNETRLSNYGKFEGFQLYGGEFHFVGRVKPKYRILNGIRKLFGMHAKLRTHEINDRFSCSFNRFADEFRHAPTRPLSYISFSVKLPWLLDEPEPDYS